MGTLCACESWIPPERLILEKPDILEAPPIAACNVVNQGSRLRLNIATLARLGFDTHSLSKDLPMFDVNLHESVPMISRYFQLLMQVDLLVTLSCFSHWNASEKRNGAGKLIPVPPVVTPAGAEDVCLGEKVRVFFLDDNINFADGSGDGAGICNLRDAVTSEYLDFTEGKNGFRKQRFARHTLVHVSSEYRVVLVQANILDAMSDQNYFIKCLEAFSEPGEKLLVHVDVNSTIVCVDTVSAKGMENILLGTMFEFTELVPKTAFEMSFEDRGPVKVDKKISLKSLVKKLAKDDKSYYQTFYEEDRCMKFFDACLVSGSIRWTNKTDSLSKDEFHVNYKEYLSLIQNGLDDIGVCAGWYTLYDFLKRSNHSVCLHTFGVDTKSVLKRTVVDEGQVVHVAVNHKLWDARDVKKFNEVYGVNCRRRSECTDGENDDKIVS